MDKLAHWAKEAKRLGMHYGDYVAAYHPSLPDLPPPGTVERICPWCGKRFFARNKMRLYCTDLCRQNKNQAKKREQKLAAESEELCSTTL